MDYVTEMIKNIENKIFYTMEFIHIVSMVYLIKHVVNDFPKCNPTLRKKVKQRILLTFSSCGRLNAKY